MSVKEFYAVVKAIEWAWTSLHRICSRWMRRGFRKGLFRRFGWWNEKAPKLSIRYRMGIARMWRSLKPYAQTGRYTLRPLCSRGLTWWKPGRSSIHVMPSESWVFALDLGLALSLHYSLAVSPKGYIDCELALKWLLTFIAYTEGKSNLARVLFLDGHISHYTIPFITCARENNIFVISYPPHCTHAMQGLDVVMFGIYMEDILCKNSKCTHLQDLCVFTTQGHTFVSKCVQPPKIAHTA